MAESFKVQVSVDLLDRASGGLFRMAGIFRQTQREADAFSASMRQIKMDLAIGGALGAFGVGIAGAMFKAAKMAGDLEQSIAAIRIEGGFSKDSMKGLTEQMFDLSDKTSIAASTIAEMGVAMRSTLHLSASEMKTLLPIFTQFADVVQFGGKKVAPLEGIKMATSFAALGGLTGENDIAKGLELFYKASKNMRGSPAEFMTLWRYTAPTMRTFNAPIEDTVLSTLFMENLGLQGRGGTAMKNLILGGIPGMSGATGDKGKALKALGLAVDGKASFLDATGKINIFGMFESLAKSRETLGPEKFAGALKTGLGMTGGQGGMLAAMKESMDLWKKLRQIWNDDLGSINKDQSEQQKLFAQQLERLKSNFENLIEKIFLPHLPAIGGFLKTLGDTIKALADHLNPTVTGAILKFFGALAAISIGTSIAVTIGMVAKLIGLLAGAGAMAGGGGALAAAAGGGSLLAAVTGLISPLGWVVIGLGALAGILLLISGNAKKARPALEEGLKPEDYKKFGLDPRVHYKDKEILDRFYPTLLKEGLPQAARMGGGMPAYDDAEKKDIEFFQSHLSAMGKKTGSAKNGRVQVFNNVINVTHRQGEDTEGATKRAVAELVNKMRLSGGGGGGTPEYESPMTHGVTP